MLRPHCLIWCRVVQSRDVHPCYIWSRVVGSRVVRSSVEIVGCKYVQRLMACTIIQRKTVRTSYLVSD